MLEDDAHLLFGSIQGKEFWRVNLQIGVILGDGVQNTNCVCEVFGDGAPELVRSLEVASELLDFDGQRQVPFELVKLRLRAVHLNTVIARLALQEKCIKHVLVFFEHAMQHLLCKLEFVGFDLSQVLLHQLTDTHALC